MLENLGNRFQDIFKKVRGHGKLSESNIKDALREVKMSLLEADVNYKVVKDFINIEFFLAYLRTGHFMIYCK